MLQFNLSETFPIFLRSDLFEEKPNLIFSDTNQSREVGIVKSRVTRPTGHEAPALLKHYSSASLIIHQHYVLALLKLLSLLVLLALTLSKLLALSCVILESS